MNSVERLVFNAQHVFNGKPWYGISVMEKIKSIDYQIVNDKPMRASRSIAEIIGHMIKWKSFAIEKLNYNEAFDIKIDSEGDWPGIVVKDESDWQNLIIKLKEKQGALIATLKKKDSMDLNHKAKGRAYDLHTLSEGIIQHDIYHLGQIAILHKILARS
jgi:uncharacterized damage-inducible protein DinB